MKRLKTFFFGVIVGLIMGLWFGYNLGKGRDFYANPFAEKSVQENIKSRLEQGREAVGEGVERVGEEIKGKLDDQ